MPSTSRLPTASPSATDAGALGLDDARLSLLETAARAPSGHNAQPWRVTLRDARHWTLDIAPDRRLPAVDPEDREAVISLGAFLETLETAAPALGLAVREVEVAPGPEVRLSVVDGPRADDPAGLEAIWARRTRRRGLRPDPLPDDVVADLLDDMPDVRFIGRGTHEADGLAEAAAEGARHQTARDDAQEELSHWIRWRRSEEARRPTGLTPESMEMPAPLRWLAHAVFTPATVLSSGFRKQGTALATRQAQEGAGWFVVFTPDASAPALIDAGQRYQRLGLRGVRHGIGLHPMSQMLEEPAVRDRVAALLKAPRDTVQMVLRTGYARPAAPPPGPRLPVPAFVRRAE
ncbi:Dinucleotide-utilizing enzymes involved in molybdopterin and thiamine biosynthesis family 2 [Caenispirillum salinarum AK4]|uniref:Dinucleotide-utilizing enzymes involved in molybdopterin and thiamine biosynthesis family 2 n=1 Tax=Caenispirillum salinarum AK4 TaxID=1238182 RepID=K9HNV0_9PROT|nr:dinucleotide-utilizing enzymes involved in molybdopterin and thiamine biosynthesis family 2 [Caenispirillum salinarum]EKV30131.1 Dinucleotide-utilizing enzymes involved in molybdopterin and thiamine biosynthesis family 2 [Caenispirillum salinarum AK4]